MHIILLISIVLNIEITLNYGFQLPKIIAPDNLIVGGRKIRIEDVPYQVSLRYFSLHKCGASIITALHMLTAAHCTNGFPAIFMNTYFGSDSLAFGGQYRRVILPITFNQVIQPIELPIATTKLNPPSNRCGRVTGWGYTNQDKEILSIKLQFIDIPFVNQTICRNAYGMNFITDNMICYGFYGVGGKDTCQGDSGGPLVIDGIQYGITSWGTGCGDRRYPGVYTKIENYINFIDDVINKKMVTK